MDRLKPKVREFLKQNKDDDAYMSLGQLALSLTKDDIAKMSQNAFRFLVTMLRIKYLVVRCAVYGNQKFSLV